MKNLGPRFCSIKNYPKSLFSPITNTLVGYLNKYLDIIFGEKMKIALTTFLFLLLLSYATLAVGQQGNGDRGTGNTPTNTIQKQESQYQGGNNEYGQETGQGIQTQQEQRTQERERVQISQQRQEEIRQEVERIRVMVQQRQQEMNREMQKLNANEQKMYQNYNQVRMVVHTLLEMENLTGGIGRNISAIAREFNNSIQATMRMENKIQTRSGIAKFFFGGDSEAAKEIESQVNQNRLRIRELSQNMENCQCDEQVRAMLQEQIQNMEQEQTRLQQLAQKEKSNKGLFGWIWKR